MNDRSNDVLIPLMREFPTGKVDIQEVGIPDLVTVVSRELNLSKDETEYAFFKLMKGEKITFVRNPAVNAKRNYLITASTIGMSKKINGRDEAEALFDIVNLIEIGASPSVITAVAMKSKAAPERFLEILDSVTDSMKTAVGFQQMLNRKLIEHITGKL